MLNEYTYAGKYAQLVKEGKVFSVATQGITALTSAFATTYTGLAIQNPVASVYDIVLIDCNYVSAVAVPSATILGLMTAKGATNLTGNLTPKNRYNSDETSTVLAADSCTLPATPSLDMLITTAWTEATTAGTIAQPNIIDLDGKFILSPGEFIAFYSRISNSAAFYLGFTWAVIKR